MILLVPSRQDLLRFLSVLLELSCAVYSTIARESALTWFPAPQYMECTDLDSKGAGDESAPAPTNEQVLRT